MRSSGSAPCNVAFSRVAEAASWPKGLFDDNLRPRRKPRRGDTGGESGERRRRNRQVDQAQWPAGDRDERPEVVVGLDGHEAQALREPGEATLVDPGPGEGLDRLLRVGPETVVVPVQRSDPDDIAGRGEQALDIQVVEGGEELAGRQVAGGADD